MFWLVLLLILLGGGFYFYQRMVALEHEIRAEQEREKEQQENQGNEEISVAAPLKKESPQPTTETPVEPPAEVVENPVLRIISAQPGVVQSDLYTDLPQLNKKQVQQMVRELVDAGKIKRERLGSSFKLYLA
jgi:hypothetical protein